MPTLSIILLVIAILVILEGLIITFFPIQINKILQQLKNKTLLRKIGIIEMIIGIIILILALLL